ncbi:hypothetical protein FF38_08589 [Lucilia cuprina]|uniref:Uncharacterized protein n=1 Tax=Lucilia cuprina TaxID=7375 RepID=A0A0L0C4Z3_LUCCU|nr:hypothetical protein FF38_08589 [Lucilia cuprina]
MKILSNNDDDDDDDNRVADDEKDALNINSYKVLLNGPKKLETINQQQKNKKQPKSNQDKAKDTFSHHHIFPKCNNTKIERSSTLHAPGGPLESFGIDKKRLKNNEHDYDDNNNNDDDGMCSNVGFKELEETKVSNKWCKEDGPMSEYLREIM